MCHAARRSRLTAPPARLILGSGKCGASAGGNGSKTCLGVRAMAIQAQRFAEWLPAARNGSAQALGDALEACRVYLLAVAEHELDPELRGKGGASDLVQETF